MVSVSMVLSGKDDISQPPVSHYHVLEPPKLHQPLFTFHNLVICTDSSISPVVCF